MEWSRGRVIGRGSTATVSLATSLASGQIFALKSSNLPSSFSLQREQSILSNLTSPYIVKYIGSAVSDDNNNNTPMYNLCMEYAAGGNLTELIRRRGGRLTEAEIATTARRILLGLDYLHGHGLAHCDIKPQNILVNEEDVPIIGDFGCAKFVVAGGDDTESRVLSGTPAFMSPEVARGEEQGFAADVWSVGCTVIEMASGKSPWSEVGDDNPVSALFRIGFSDDSPAVPSWLSDEAKDFVGKCLIKDPKQRWTVAELLDHRFLHESELLKEVVIRSSSSPSCVLDHGFWESLEGIDTDPENMTIQLETCCSRIPGGDDRIKSLTSTISNLPNWSLDEEGDDGWITVRSNDDSEETEAEEQGYEENDGVLVGRSELDAALFWEYSPDEEFVELGSVVIITSTSDGFVVGREFDDINNTSTHNSTLQQIFSEFSDISYS
ncbi:Mitogen-activated protein kinase kinase kinase 17 [Linum grandiflorum]